MNKISNFKTRLEEILEEHNQRAAWLSRESGISKGTICQYLKGVYEPKREQLCRMAEVLDVSPDWLEGYDAPKHIDDSLELVCRIAVYSINDLDTPLRYEVCDPIYKDCFFIEADDHLYPVANTPDLVMLEKADTLEDGQAALIAFRQYRGLYIYRTCEDGAQLCCLNAYYPPVRIRGDELGDLKILGKVVMSIKMW